MEIEFDKEYLRELYETGVATDKKHRFQPDIVRRYQARIKALERASKTEDLYTLRSLRYEKLKGDKAGLESIRVNDQYRIEFKTAQVVSETVITVCNILELSNHYKLNDYG
jgi:proteic killer suppression protein